MSNRNFFAELRESNSDSLSRGFEIRGSKKS
jgi:hypothetical protein